MSYLGNAPARSFISFERQVFTIVNSQTAYALSHSVTNENDIRLVVNNVVQEPGSGKAYTATGTALTLSAALTNGTDEMYCVFLGRATATSAPGAGSIGTAQLASDSVTLAKMASGTDGNIISYDASGNPVAVATGNDGQVLTSAGAGAPPVFETPASATNTPYFNAKMTGVNYNFSDGALFTINQYNSVPIDTCSGFTTSTGRYLPNVAGYYYFEFQTHIFKSASDMKMVYGQLFKNGSGGSSYSERRIQQITFNDNYGSGASVNVSGIFYMNGSSDYIYSAVVGDTNSGGSPGISGESNYTWISGFLIAAT